MGIDKPYRLKVLWTSLLLVASLVSGCAGIEPYEPRDNREEGPQNGLFTGAEGEFVIFRSIDAPQTGGEIGKSSGGTAEGEDQKTGSRKKAEDNKKDEQ